MASIDKARNINDLRLQAKKRLPWAMWEFLEGGSDDEWSLANNRKAFDKYQLIPRSLVDVSNIDTRCDVLGLELSSPLILAPTGMNRMYHGKGELAAAAAAHRTDTLYSLSTYSSYSIETIDQRNPSQKIFQLFINPGWDTALNLIARAKAANYQALCLTVDTTAAPNKERDILTKVESGGVNLKSLASIMAHPRWIYGLLAGGPLQLANLNASPFEAKEHQWREATLLNWDKVAHIRELWQGPLALKGIVNVEDAKKAAAVGVDCIIISNHGGRQMDCLPAPIDLLEEFVTAVGNDIDIIIDSGIRRGTDILKALALGAKACMIGRPYLYGLAAGGEAGVIKAIKILQAELIRDMTLLGLPSLRDISTAFIRKQ